MRLRICVEAPEPSGQRAAIYIWPRDQRQVGPNGKPGSLHAKLAIADDAQLFISSAKLTDYAMNLNMELGVLIRGGRLPGRVSAHFAALMREAVLERVGVGGWVRELGAPV